MNEENLSKIIDLYGTPTYIFDIKELKNRINYLKSKLPTNVEICYAIKANTFIIDDVKEEFNRFEVCSPGEFEICNKKNIAQSKILISGVYKTPKVIEEMLQKYTEIDAYTIESLEQFKLFKDIKNNKKIKLLLRLTSGNQFGIEEKDIEEIIKNRENYSNLEIKGIQYFSGTQKISINNIKREIEYVDGFINKLEKEYGYKAEEFEYGGGFPVFYFENQEFDEENYLNEVSEIFKQINFKGKVIIELGRSVVASCGYYITKVVDKKKNKNQNYAILDGGMNHIVYYGQSMGMKVPKCEIFPKRVNGEIENWNLCGSLCTINDILVKQLPISDLKIGDVIVFKNTGAYCVTEGISLFLSRNLPKVLKLNEKGDITLIRKEKTTYELNM